MMRDAGYLCDASLRRKVALEDREMALRVHRVLPLPYDVLVLGRSVANVFEGFGDGLTADCEGVAVDEAVTKQCLHYLRDAACAMEVGGDVAARRFEVA